MRSSRLVWSLLVALLACAGPAVAHAEEVAAKVPSWHAGMKTGLLLPQLGSELGTALDLMLEGGYRVFGGLAIGVGLGFAQPAVSHAGSDPRLAAGRYTTETTQQELTGTLFAMWRLRQGVHGWNAYGGGGLRAYYLRTLTSGEANGQAFLENRETSLRLGGLLLAGGEYGFGWGAGLAELELGGSDLPHLVTGEVATTALSLSLGLRVFF